MSDKLKIHFAPLQGFTEAPYRQAHAIVCGGVSEYYTPFIRYEHGEIRRKDLRDIARPEIGVDFDQVPQVIAAGTADFDLLCRSVIENGYDRIDLNMGCPFPLQTGKGKGAALISRVESLKEILLSMEKFQLENGVHFSVKMRLGLENPSESLDILPMLNDSCIEKITIHPRIAKQQYKGALYMDSFSEFYSKCQKPLCYNGDIQSVSDIENIQERFPKLESVMIGRGLLSRPTLANEYIEGKSVSDEDAKRAVLSIHEMVFSYYKNTLEGGQGQILQKIQPFWEYQEPLFGHKLVKSVTKTRSLKAYEELISNI